MLAEVKFSKNGLHDDVSRRQSDLLFVIRTSFVCCWMYASMTDNLKISLMLPQSQMWNSVPSSKEQAFPKIALSLIRNWRGIGEALGRHWGIVRGYTVMPAMCRELH